MLLYVPMFFLIGIVIVVVGFVLGMNPLLVVTVAGLATGIAGGLGRWKSWRRSAKRS